MGIILFWGCTEQEGNQTIPIPDHINDLKNLTIYPLNEQPYDTVKLVKEIEYLSNNNIFIDGIISDVAVDRQNRVYIAASKPGKAGVYIFDADGTYLNTLAQYGRGPGDYESISSIAIYEDTLYVFDPILQKIGFFSNNDFSHIKDLLIKKKNRNQQTDFFHLMRAVDIYVLNKGSIYVKFQINNLNKLNMNPESQFYQISREGDVIPNLILREKRHRFYLFDRDKGTGIRYGFTAPFTRSSLITSTHNGFFTAWTEDFLIKKYDKEGNYREAFYYPIKRAPLSVGELDLAKVRINLIQEQGEPELWPALHAMETDDEGHLWVATITSSDSTYQWWVLDKHGELTARFTFRGERSSRNPFTGQAMIVISNGYFYAKEWDRQFKENKIVKYKIEFTAR